jgi:HEAT repeat protein
LKSVLNFCLRVASVRVEVVPMKRTAVARDARGELWFWRGCSALALSVCAVLLFQATRARSSAHNERADQEPDELQVQSRTSHADTALRAVDSARRNALLANLERARSVSARCMALDRLARLPELDEAAVAQIARFSEPEFPAELRRCSGAALGNVAHEAAFAPLYALAQCELPMLVETALTALAMRPDRASHKAAIELSRDGPRALQVAVACALAEAGAMEATPQLAALLADGSGRDRERLLMALGRASDPRAVGVLQKYLATGNRSMQQMAIYALGEVGGPAATETLLHVLRERPELAGVAASALARSGGDDAREALLALAEQGSSYGVGLSALQALSDMDGPGVRELMERALGEGSSSLNVAVEYFVSRRDEGALPMLAQLARSGSMQTAPQALSGLARLGGEQANDVLEEVAKGGGPMAQTALQMLSSEQADPARAKRIALAQLERNAAAPGAVDVLMQDESPEAHAALTKLALGGDPNSASRALMSLAQRNDPETRKLLEKLAGPGSDPQRRATAMWALAQSGDPAVIKTLRSGLDDSQDHVRREALQALSQFGGPEAEAAFFAASHDKSPEVVGVAAGMLGQLGTPAALDRLEELAKVPAMASSTMMALVNSAPQRALPLAEQFVNSADADTRRSALVVAQSMPGDAGTHIFVTALHSSDPEFVREAMESAANSGYQSEELRAALRELSSSRGLPDDLKARAAELGAVNTVEGTIGMGQVRYIH